MTPEELRTRFLLYGIDCRVKRDEVLLQTCVFCGNTRWNLEVNPVSGVYHCWTCNAGGRVDRLLKEVIGITVHIPVNLESREGAPRRTLPTELMGEPVAEVTHLADYIHGRHLSAIDMAVYQMRAGRGSQWENRIVFPLLEYWSRELLGYIGRTVVNENPKWYSFWSGKKVVAGYRTRSDVHVIVEGIFDGIRVHKAGFNSAMLLGTGVPVVEEWAARVPAAHTVVVMLDGDAAKEAEKLYWTIYPIHENVKALYLPQDMDPDKYDPCVLELLIMREIHTNLPGSTSVS